MLVSFDGDVAGKTHVPTLIGALSSKVKVTRIAVHHDFVWRTNPKQSFINFVVRFTVVNHQGDVAFFGNANVLFERKLLKTE